MKSPRWGAVAVAVARPVGTIVGARDVVTLQDLDELRKKVATFDGPLVLLTAPTDRREVAKRMAIDRLPESGPTAIFEVDLPPLALQIAAELVVSALAEDGLGAALDVAGSVEHLVLGSVLVSSVAKVDAPAPTLAQTVRSWLPGSRFSIVLGAHRGVGPADWNPAPTEMEPVVRGQHAPADWAVVAAADWAAGASVRELHPGTLFGNDHWLQLVWADLDGVERTRAQAKAREHLPCRWCEQPTVSPVCAFCGYSDTDDLQQHEGNPA